MSDYPEIIFDAERMKYAHTGIYHYCLQLGKALISEQANRMHKLGFYVPAPVKSIFGADEFYIMQNSLHKLLMPPLTKHKVWHTTYQGTNYFPSAPNIKKIITVHDLNFLHEKKSVAKQNKYLRILQQKLDRTDGIVAISNFVKQEIEQHLKLKGKQVQVIYNGCNINNEEIAQQPKLPFDGPFLFSIGTITPKKNFHVLPAALLGNKLHLVIAGIVQDDRYLQQIYQQAKQLGVSDRLHVIGTVTEPEKYWLLQKCSLFLFPSLAEGFGLPVIEAMRFGTPVLLSTCTSLPEIGGDSAFYMQSFEPSHISEMTTLALENSTEQLRQKNIAWSEKFSWQNAAKYYWNIYEILLNE